MYKHKVIIFKVMFRTNNFCELKQLVLMCAHGVKSRKCMFVEFETFRFKHHMIKDLPCKLSGRFPCLFPTSFPALESGSEKKLEVFLGAPRIVSRVSV